MFTRFKPDVPATILALALSASAQTSSAIEFYDTTGATATSRIGWTGSATGGNIYISTPDDGNGVSVKNGVITAEGFVGNGSGLTGIIMDIDDNAVTTAMIANRAVTDDKIDSVSWSKIRGVPASVTNPSAATVADSSITSAKIRDGAVTNAKIESVSWSKLTDVPAGFADGIDNEGSGTGSSISGISAGAGLSGGGASGTVTISAAFSRSGTVDSVARADHSHTITSAMIGDGEVKTADIENGAVTDAKITGMSWSKLTGVPAGFADGTDDVGVSSITAGAGITVTGGTTASPTISVSSITGSMISANAIDSTHIAAGAVKSADIFNGTIKDADISSSSADRIAGSKIVPDFRNNGSVYLGNTLCDSILHFRNVFNHSNSFFV